MKKENVCQHCSKPLGAEAIEGLCPECLMKMGLGIGTEATGRTRSFVPPTPAELAPQFPQLEILAFVGQGGMGAVYKARQKQLDRTVALKILPPGIGEDPAFAARFAREAKAMARLNHPGIVTIHDFGQVQGCARVEPAPGADAAANSSPESGTTQDPLYYFVMEFVDGVSLRQLMRTGRVSPREALAIVPQICDALQYAHDQGIVHRDIKPENILLDRQGRVKVADFGLAKLMGTDGFSTLPSASIQGGSAAACRAGTASPTANLTDKDRVMGTPHYMAPEQVDHPAAVDHRADIYSLGVVFYQMLTGELPGQQLEPPSKKAQIDVRLDKVVLRALEKEPERRYDQVSEVKTAVETIVHDSAAEPGPRRSASGRKAALPANWSLLAGVSVGVIMMLLAGCLHFKASRAQKTVDLLQRYPTTLTAGDFSEAHAQSWQFTEADIYRLRRFSLQVSNDLLVELGSANVGIGHCADGALWALLIPQQSGTVTSRVAGRAEPVAQVWLRFHPKEINRVFPPETVSPSGATNLAAQMRFIANLKLNPKLGSSFISFPQGYDGPVKLTIPRPQDMTVDVDLRDGVRRFFMVDTAKETARQDTQQWYQYVHPESKTATSAQSAEDYIAQQLKEANAGNDWAKYRLWEAYFKGNHGVTKDPAKADRWLRELVQGVCW